MNETTKEACRLLFECMDELRLHDEEYQHRTSPFLKIRLAEFLKEQGLDDPATAVAKLCQ